MSQAIGTTAQDRRAHVAELDRAIIELVRQRTAICRELTERRLSKGGTSIELARENEVLGHYREALGPTGTSLALLLTELGRRGAVRPGGLPGASGGTQWVGNGSTKGRS
ncbi:hypothetical protein ACWCQW_20590 [Streptomyces mirabilis]